MFDVSTIQRGFPAVLNTVAAPEKSDRYQVVDSGKIIEVFNDNGWFVHDVQQTRRHIKTVHRRQFAKHLVTFRNNDLPTINGVAPQISLFNAHNGLAKARLLAGLIRFICENGLIVSDAEFADFRVKHNRFAPERIDEGIKQIVEIVPQIVNKTEEMNSLILSPIEQIQFNERIISQIWEDPKVRPLKAAQLLETRRDEDKEPTLWNVYNRTQEHLMNGGLVGNTTTNRKRVQKGITNIDKSIKINQILWNQADKFLQAA